MRSYMNKALSRQFTGGKEQLFRQMALDNWTSTCRRMKLDPYFTPYAEINSKSVKDLKVRVTLLNS